MVDGRVPWTQIITCLLTIHVVFVWVTMHSGCFDEASTTKAQVLEEHLSLSRIQRSAITSRKSVDSRQSITLRDSMNVLFAISEDNPVTLAELEVALKSVLLHAPLHNPLSIHIMADTPAYLALNELWTSTNLSSWRTRNPISVHAHHISPNMVQRWKQQIRLFFQGAGYQKSQMHLVLEHTIGAYFRLHANRVLPPTIQRVLYMDTDVVLLANLQMLMPLFSSTGNHNGSSPLFYWTANMCSGFMVIDVERLPSVWNLSAAIDLKRIGRDKLKNHRPNDQLILRAINLTFPEEVGVLSSDLWDGHIADSLWRFPFRVSENRPRLGMLHFNGGGADMGTYFEQHEFLKHENPDTQRTFGLVKEQVYLPWSRVRFRLESLVRPGDGSSFLLKLHYRSVVADVKQETKH